MEVNYLLNDYPKPLNPRYVGKGIRTVKHRLVASKRDKEFFDGGRDFGYGGFVYDGRWKDVAEKISQKYLKRKNSKFLQINCEKGFLVHDIKQLRTDVEVSGTETSDYAIANSMASTRDRIKKNEPYALSFPDSYFDFVIALGVVYTFTLNDAVRVLKEIGRVSNGNSFVTLAAYETEEEYFLFKDWTLLGALIYKREEWLEILTEAGYKGDYLFTNAKYLHLIRN